MREGRREGWREEGSEGIEGGGTEAESVHGRREGEGRRTHVHFHLTHSMQLADHRCSLIRDQVPSINMNSEYAMSLATIPLTSLSNFGCYMHWVAV